jgi:hypothetical protein
VAEPGHCGGLRLGNELFFLHVYLTARVHATKSKFERASGFGTPRTGFMVLPQEGQRKIVRLSAKIIDANPSVTECTNNG